MDAEVVNLGVGAVAGGIGLEIAKQLYKAYVGKVVDKNAEAMSNLPELFLHFEYIKTSITKIELQLEQLAGKKEENTRRLIVLEEKARAAHKRLDNITGICKTN